MNPQLTDAVLPPLEELPRLEHVNVTGSKVTDAAVERFQSARPKVQVSVK
jgi:hypothetical protein